MKHTSTKILLIVGLFLLSAFTTNAITTKTTTDFTIVNTYTRTGTQYYTEGLAFLDSNTLIESAGLYGKSTIQLIKFPSMTISKQTKLGTSYFSEGCVPLVVNGVTYIHQMTWKEGKVFVYKASDLTLYKTITFPSTIKEGWGLTKGSYTSNGKTITAFYVSNGSNTIYIVDPSNWKVLHTFTVKKRNNAKITQLNELEMINGKIWANIYMTTQVAIIDPSTGYVDTIVDFAKLQTLAKTKASSMGLKIGSGDVLNGIAYDSTNNRIIVSGKRWPLMWQVKVNGI